MTERGPRPRVDLEQEREPNDYLPLSEATVLIMLSVFDAPLHGYRIREQISILTEGRIEMAAATLYENLKSQTQIGFLETSPSAQQGGAAPRTVDYKLSEFGRKVLQAEKERINQLKELIDAKLGNHE